MASTVTFPAAIIVLSDRAHSGERPDGCIPIVRALLRDTAFTLDVERVLPDDAAALQAALIELCDGSPRLVLTSGGTGVSARDRTPQATSAVLDYDVPGIAEAMRAASLVYARGAMLSRAVAGVRNTSLIVNLPGSPKAVGETLAAILDVLPHALAQLAGDASDTHTIGSAAR